MSTAELPPYQHIIDIVKGTRELRVTMRTRINYGLTRIEAADFLIGTSDILMELCDYDGSRTIEVNLLLDEFMDDSRWINQQLISQLQRGDLMAELGER